MNIIDGLIVAVIGISILIGFIRGITKEVFGLLSWGGAAVAAYIGLPILRNVARNYITNPLFADGVTVLGIFIIFLILLSLISHILSSYVRESALGGVDRSLGFAFGLIRGIVMICAVDIALSTVIARPMYPKILTEARFSKLIYKASDIFISILPSSLRSMVEQQALKQIQEAQKKLQAEMGDLAAKQLSSQLPIPGKKENVDPQKTAEELSQLKPQTKPTVQENSKEPPADAPEDAKKKQPSYSQSSKGEMDRLLDSVKE